MAALGKRHYRDGLPERKRAALPSELADAILDADGGAMKSPTMEDHALLLS